MLENDEFLVVVKNTPLVSIDLIIRSQDNALLMGLRLNEPAAGFWFVPGGRVKKDESIDEAFLRITKTELAISYTIDHAKLLGAFTHKYRTNFAEIQGIGTHYVVLAYELKTEIEIDNLPKEQHSKYKWILPNDNGSDIHEHSKAYFK